MREPCFWPVSVPAAVQATVLFLVLFPLPRAMLFVAAASPVTCVGRGTCLFLQISQRLVNHSEPMPPTLTLTDVQSQRRGASRPGGFYWMHHLGADLNPACEIFSAVNPFIPPSFKMYFFSMSTPGRYFANYFLNYFLVTEQLLCLNM